MKTRERERKKEKGPSLERKAKILSLYVCRRMKDIQDRSATAAATAAMATTTTTASKPTT